DDNTTGTLFYNDRTMRGESRVHSAKQFKPTETSYVARQYGIDVQHEWDFRGGKDYLIAGVTGKQETYRATQAPVYTRPHRNTYAVYSSYSREINPKWTAILGLRYTAISDPIKDQYVLTPQFQLLHTINKASSMYLNIGKAYTMPSLSDSFRSVNRQYTAVSGKNLKPEEGWNYELGYKRLNKKDSWKVDVFYMDFKNFFQWQPDVNGRPTVRVNGGKFHNVGIEAEYSRHLSDRLKMSVSGSYSNPKQKEMNETYWKQAAPKLQFTTGIHYKSPTWEAGTSFSFVTKRLRNRDGGLNPNIALWNAYVGYHFNKDA
ncbi:TonB-dependent receptor, partial [Salmonella enterica subsp. enterica serovar London]|nr:TonB-dependent receptor [Salmonella enterica subsp. enterica serovar London]